jgi:eukaryotic-like serine/threonine-protein kinase
MTKRIIGLRPVSTPSDLRSSRDGSRALPEDLLHAASRRLGVLSVLFAVLWLLGTATGQLAGHELFPDNKKWLWPDDTDAIATISILVSLALYAYTRKPNRNPQFVLDLGLWYLGFTALALGLTAHVEGAPPNYHILPEISWIGAMVLIYAAIIPTAPKKMLIAGLIAVSMNPISMLILGKVKDGWSFGSPWLALVMHQTDFLLVGAAVVISHVVTRVGQQVTKARELGSYQLGELLGRGGMGEVYKARHRMLARPAAIKLIRPAMLGAVDEEAAKLAVTRFKREAEAAASLRSQHTVELYDFGVTADGTLYLVMEYLEGMDLETLVRECGSLSTGRIIHILRQVCESLSEAHAIGLVHRDIKPANIHVGRVGLNHDFVKVLDFGLVKEVSSISIGDSMSTTPGQMALGTPGYMAPELALGEPIDCRADIYALGCVAYCLVTGQLVFEADTAFQMIAKHLQSAPIPPSQRIAKPVSPELERLILKCLAKAPIERPQTAAQFAQALEFIAADPWDEDQARQWWENNARPQSALA